jgi:hypothetical protein
VEILLGLMNKLAKLLPELLIFIVTSIR